MEHFQRTRLSVPEDVLTVRERDALGLVCAMGIAEALGISENSVVGYIKSIYRKLERSSCAEACWDAARMGLARMRYGG